MTTLDSLKTRTRKALNEERRKLGLAPKPAVGKVRRLAQDDPIVIALKARAASGVSRFDGRERR